MKKVALFMVLGLCLPFAAACAGVNSLSDTVQEEAPDNRKLIKVGTSERPPLFISHSTKDVTNGVLEAMNAVQNDFWFSVRDIPVKRRSHSVKAGMVDIVMWDNPAWEWQIPLDTSWPLLQAKDVFIALKDKAGGKGYFDSYTDKTFSLVSGYTYKFLGPEKKSPINPEVIFVKSEEISIKMLLANRVDIAVTSDVTLKWFLEKNPQVKPRILISDRPEVQYERMFLVPKESPITASEINQILLVAGKQGLLESNYKRFGLDAPDYTRFQ